MPVEFKSLSKASALDPNFYTNSDVFQHEMRSLLPSGWQVVAPADRLSGIGDVISRQLGDIPIVIVRSKSGQLNGFYNICPHRAGPLATCDARMERLDLRARRRRLKL